MRKNVMITVEENLLKEYKKLCIDKDWILSFHIEEFMKKELKEKSKK